jgi:hypothetical protein
METSDLERPRRRSWESVEPRQRTLGTDKRKVKGKGQVVCLLVSYMPLACATFVSLKSVRDCSCALQQASDLSSSSTCTALRRSKGIRMA